MTLAQYDADVSRITLPSPPEVYSAPYMRRLIESIIRIVNTKVSVSDAALGAAKLSKKRTPATAGDTGAAGDVCWDSNYLYVCVATNSWKRVAIAAW